MDSSRILHATSKNHTHLSVCGAFYQENTDWGLLIINYLEVAPACPTKKK